MKKILLTTVCGPFGKDTDDCTRHVMPELFHAQVTRAQGVFSLRATYISYGLEYIAKNISTPSVVLQYPTMKQFEKELKKDRIKHIKSQPHHPMTLGKIERFWKNESPSKSGVIFHFSIA